MPSLQQPPHNLLRALPGTGAAQERTTKLAEELSASRQRDQRIYLTQEVWVRQELVSPGAHTFLKGEVL